MRSSRLLIALPFALVPGLYLSVTLTFNCPGLLSNPLAFTQTMSGDNAKTVFDWTEILSETLVMLRETFAFANNTHAEWSMVQDYNFDAHKTSLSSVYTISLAQLVADLASGPYNQCGKAKCFIQSQSNDSTGWLVTDASVFQLMYGRRPLAFPEPRTRWHSMVYAWVSTFELEEQYGLRHFFLKDSPPILFANLTTKDMNSFNQQIEAVLLQANTSDVDEWKALHVRWQHGIQQGRGLVAQRVVRAPGKIKVIKRRRSINRFHRLVRLSHGPPKSWQFYTNLLSGIRSMRDMLRDYPALWHDFQFAVDRETGQVFQIDMDRQLEFFYRFPIEPICYQTYRKEIEEQVDCLLNQYLAEIAWEVKENDKDNSTHSMKLMYRGADPSECRIEDNTRPCLGASYS